MYLDILDSLGPKSVQKYWYGFGWLGCKIRRHRLIHLCISLTWPPLLLTCDFFPHPLFVSLFPCSPRPSSSRCGGNFAINEFSFSCSAPHACTTSGKCVPDTNGTFSLRGCQSKCNLGGNGLEWGSDALLILFVGLVVPYCVVGMAWQKYRKGESGRHLVPHREFWVELPRLAWEGCGFSLKFMLGWKVQWNAASRYETL
jgi:hypothetical protein